MRQRSTFASLCRRYPHLGHLGSPCGSQALDSKVIGCTVLDELRESLRYWAVRLVQKQSTHAATIHAVHTDGRFASYAPHGGRTS
jgi:hypothetical protein